jgi:DNA-directed RNA polymerase specialized sigma24 family protein
MTDWDRFYKWLNPDPDLAASEYRGIRLNLISVFKSKSCHDPEGLADQTIERVVQTLPKYGDALPDNPLRYCFGVARYIHMEYRRSNEVTKNGGDPSGLSQHPYDPAESEEDETLDSCLHTCLQKLDKEKRELFLRYYLVSPEVKSDLHQKMADEMGITLTALRLQILRIKEKLRSCINECRNPDRKNSK